MLILSMLPLFETMDVALYDLPVRHSPVPFDGLHFKEKTYNFFNTIIRGVNDNPTTKMEHSQ
jgi:hypothetical protein